MKRENILKLCVVLFYTKLVSCASIKMSNDKINVDEFLKTVMDSEKFDEIAEKIADKAVEKFSKLKDMNTGMASVSNVDADSDTAYRVSEAKDPEVKVKDPNISESNIDKSEAEMSTTQQYVGKIDTEAFMKKDSADSSKHLSLKFKYFKKNVQGTKSKEVMGKQISDVEEVTPSKEINEDQSEIEGDNNNQSDQKVSTTDANEPESDVETTTMKTKISKYSSKHNKFRKKKTVKISPPQDKDSRENSNEKGSQSDAEDPVPALEPKQTNMKKRFEKKRSKDRHKDKSVEAVTKGSSESSSLNKEDLKQSEEKSDTEYKVRKPGYEYLKLPESDSGPKKRSEDNLENTTLKLRIKDRIKFSKVTEKQKEKSSSKLAPILVHEEGNQLYTQERSPDYEDYHNEISRIQKDLKKI